jgi:3-oxoacyl-[acyl-carrier-protein] synthase III
VQCTQDIFVAGTGSRLGSTTQSLSEVVAAGLVREHHSDLGYVTVRVDEGGTAAPDMAIAAGRTAIRRSGVRADEFSLHLHACLWFQGVDYWSAGNYIALNTVGERTATFSLDQRSCGGMGGLHLAAAYLQSGAASAALVTTADRFPGPNFDRWNSQSQVIYGDGSAAVVLSTRTGFARLLSTAAVADNTLEAYSRGTKPFVEFPGTEVPVPVHDRYEEHMAATPDSEADWARWAAGLLAARDNALAEAELKVADISRIITPFAHRGGGQAEVHDVLGFTEAQTLWLELGRHTGHVGSGDQLIGLNHLVETNQVAPGDRVMLYGLGMGFNFNAAVIEILDVPAW